MRWADYLIVHSFDLSIEETERVIWIEKINDEALAYLQYDVNADAWMM
jgi:hypothetical protein